MTKCVYKKGMRPYCSSSLVNLMLPAGSIWFKCCVKFSVLPFLVISKMSSTYRFHNLGVQIMGAVASYCLLLKSLHEGIDCDGVEWATHATHGRASNLLLDDTLESKVSKWLLKQTLK